MSSFSSFKSSSSTTSLPALRYCVLQPSYEDSTSEIAKLDFGRDLSPWIPSNALSVQNLFLSKARAFRQIRDVVESVDVFINLCDGALDEDSPGIEVVQHLEYFGKAFTGNGSETYDPSRATMKKIFEYWGVRSPNYFFIYHMEDLETLHPLLKFPLFVKHHHSYNSVGITAKSLVRDVAELRAQVSIMLEKYHGALVEEFISGKEFSVLVASNPENDQDPITFHPVECIFSAASAAANANDEGAAAAVPPIINFKTFDYKWSESKNPWVQCRESEEKIREMQEMTKTVFTALGCTGYARSDIRMDHEGNLFMLEINPNCSVFYPDDNGATADQILLFQHPETGKHLFLDLLVRFALARQASNEKKFIVKSIPGKSVGFGMYAARDIKEGEMIYSLEEKPHHLVSRAKVEQTWTPKYKEFFTDFCYPLTDDLFVMWDRKPENWKPINHCCDPNAWTTGLDLFARRDIKKGEEIRMDYATMYTSQHMEFECKCGSQLCRGKWRGDDFKQDWFTQRYGDHVSDHVVQKKKQLKEIADILATVKK